MNEGPVKRLCDLQSGGTSCAGPPNLMLHLLQQNCLYYTKNCLKLHHPAIGGALVPGAVLNVFEMKEVKVSHQIATLRKTRLNARGDP